MRWTAIKIARASITMWLVVTFVFFVLRISGDPTDMLLPDDIDQATRDFYRRLWGLDQPLLTQYWSYLMALVQGDFGISFRNNLDAYDLVMERVPKTLLLTGTALIISLAIGIPLGILAALAGYPAGILVFLVRGMYQRVEILDALRSEVDDDSDAVR